MIIVVGIGADGMAGFSEASRSRIATGPQSFTGPRGNSTCSTTRWPPLAGSGRHRCCPRCERLPVDDHCRDIHVVASGDPMLHGIGGTVVPAFGPDKVAVLPHVSSVTLACARMGWNVHDTEVIRSGHGEPSHRGTPRRPGDRAVQ